MQLSLLHDSESLCQNRANVWSNFDFQAKKSFNFTPLLPKILQLYVLLVFLKFWDRDGLIESLGAEIMNKLSFLLLEWPFFIGFIVIIIPILFNLIGEETKKCTLGDLPKSKYDICYAHLL